MLRYICKYQDTYVYAHLFHANLIEMMDKGVQMTRLLASGIYNYTFDYDEWPGISTNTVRLLKPYNESIFKLRYKYPEVFGELWKEEQKKERAKDEREKQRLKKQNTLRASAGPSDKNADNFDKNKKAMTRESDLPAEAPG